MPINQFYLPYRPAYDHAGISVPGAKIYFTAAGGTNTPLAIYEDEALTVEHSNPVVADGAGQWGPIYLQEEEYRVRIYGRNAEVGVDTPFEEYDPYIPGALVGTVLGNASSVVATLPQLEALTGAANSAVYLAASGREGLFFWNNTDVSAQVAVDTQQGIYIAPDSDPTGASGAWVRKFSGPLDVKWFGAVADDPGSGAFGTDASPAIAGAFAYAQSVAHVGYENPTFYRGGPSVLIPKGGYYCSASLAPLFTGIIRGEGGKGWGAATRLRFAAGVDGLQLQAHNTSGKTTLDGATHFAGDRLYISDIAFLGAYSGTESDTHGIRGKRAGNIERCTFDNFEGDGLYCNTTFNSGVGTTEGNTNAMRVIDCDFQNNRRGRYMEGDDANAITLIGCSYINNRQAGIDEEGFLGNHEFGPHIDGSARTADNAGTAAQPASYTSIGGYKFFVIRGNESGASTNAPKSSTVTITIASPGVVSWTAHGLANGTQVAFATTGALPTGLSQNTAYYVVNAGANDFQVSATYGGAAINTSGTQSGTHTSGAQKDNTWWGYWEAGAASPSTGVIAWQSGLTWRPGGPVLQEGASNSSTIDGVHIESNGVSQIDQGMRLKGTVYLAHRVSSGTLFRNRASTEISSSEGLVHGGNLVCRGAFYAGEASNFIGPYRGNVVQDGITYLGTRNITHQLNFAVFDSAGAATTTVGTITSTSAAGFVENVPNAGHGYFQKVADNFITRVDSAGLNLFTGKTIKVNDVQVLKGRITGWATATGTPTRTTFDTTTVTLPQLAERVKALIDDLHGTAGHGLIGT